MRAWSAVARLQWRRFRELLSYLRQQGPSRTLQLALSAWHDRGFDDRSGFETGVLDDLQAHKHRLPALRNATIYGPTRAQPLLTLLQTLQIPPEAVFVDLGCGKGRALLVAAQHGVRRLKGVELVPDFVRICEANLRKLRADGTNLVWEIFNLDMKRYEVSPQDDVFYLYDPSGWGDVVTCLDNVLASWRRCPRRLQVIYHNNLIAKGGMDADLIDFDRFDEYCFEGNRFYVLTKEGST